MPRLTITLSEDAKAYVNAQVKARKLRSASEYFSLQLLLEQLKPHRQRINALLLEALQEGPATEMTRKDWDEIEREAMGILAKEKDDVRHGRKNSRRAPRSA